MELFEKHGYANVTMEDIAQSAGVSRRTAFRYFASKNELVMQFPREWMVVFESFVGDNKELPIRERLRLASHAVIRHIEKDPEPVKLAFRLAFSHPSLAAKYAAENQVWIERVRIEIEDRAEPDLPSMLRARIMAAAYMGMINCVCEIWAETGEAMIPLVDQSFDMLG